MWRFRLASVQGEEGWILRHGGLDNSSFFFPFFFLFNRSFFFTGDAGEGEDKGGRELEG